MITMLKPLVFVSLAAFTLLLALSFHPLIQSQLSRLLRHRAILSATHLLTNHVRRRHLRHDLTHGASDRSAKQLHSDPLNMLLNHKPHPIESGLGMDTARAE